MNKDQWISHVACSEYDFHMVFTHAHKSEAMEILIKAINIIETRHIGKVVFIRSDEERSLGARFTDFIDEKGIIFEPFASDTPAQNGHIERKGGILLTKARALRLEAGLPAYLWPWIVRIAQYIMNRTPMKKHGWKTPFELVTPNHSKSNLGHLVQFGAKAYLIDKHRPRKEKMRSKATLASSLVISISSTSGFLISTKSSGRATSSLKMSNWRARS